jgi:N-acetylglutamate synthase-like GNAT family acetyltransferase
MSADTLHIRSAAVSDIPMLTELIRDSFITAAEKFDLTPDNCPKHPSNCTDEWIEQDITRGVTYFILEYDGMPVGCVALEKATPERWYLERLAMVPSFRHREFGRTLVDHACAEARVAGGKTIGIGIIAHDTKLNGWYRKIGFIEGETKQFPHLPFQVTFMTLEL